MKMDSFLPKCILVSVLRKSKSDIVYKLTWPRLDICMEFINKNYDTGSYVKN